MQRIGVFVCHCGSNIAATVDVEKVVEYAKLEPGVVHAEDYQYMCSEAGQMKIAEAVKDKNLTGIVVCSCSPRMHETTFRNAAKRAGINPYMVEIANIREHCSWIHKDIEEGTEKAVILARAAIAKVNLNAPLEPGESRVTKRALVIGGGIAGIQTALDIADAGYEVDIVEKTPSIGGRMSQLDKTFPTLDCSACILTPKMVEAAAHEKVNIYTYSEVDKVSGFVGDFTVDIKKKARSVDMDKCTGCGVCSEKCPMKKTPSEFNRGLENRSAIYTPFAQAIPNVPVIDRENCIMFKTGKCGVCSKVCQAGAIDYEQQDEIITENYGAIVVATGFDTIKLDDFDEYAYNQSKDVITSLELERVMNAAGPTKGHLERLSDGKAPKEIVFIQCVGSRDVTCRGKEYCSKICCMYTAKHAMLIRDKYPDVNVTVFYIDVRTPGKNFDEFYRRAVEEYQVNYIKGQVGKVMPQADGKLLVQGVDLLDNRQILKEADMVVLATAIEPEAGVRKIATMLTASIDTNDFLTEAHPKLRPVESPTAGVFLSGVCQGPKDIPETVAQAGAAAVKAIGLLAKDKLMTNPCTAKADELLCNGCSTCANVCPYGAITYEEKEINDHGIRENRRVAAVNTALCQGCGACTVTCPSGAMDLQGFSNRQILAEVDAICR
ncbi:CoB--CoM heterodisulfide reductase iron-sulfur subunit A family protein [Ohessyouella blattaphilus]|uniref:CoB--CoM heterodisulfide reductase iron-sulfur subunit A family protein n=1 Tax=Ohessyouella blattaphilus TaxID=2949333 RepID=A0ABT1EFY3_9FIRM|nr:CoB--CoM heterodisulfide reductase iron-sulfur subunit A family protein [Ohessyouella blattaphilus]MCP1109620.1 CoB--CoM heterodisulfide reductase iron-sulfur subunit A family protein [Ohessyouella blattaphilus]MCR8563014.1 CoB--CoM heterodisulfide reductase iron-sulfur subunit A family protein [Ohessyouella blattaphilus]